MGQQQCRPACGYPSRRMYTENLDGSHGIEWPAESQHEFEREPEHRDQFMGQNALNTHLPSRLLTDHAANAPMVDPVTTKFFPTQQAPIRHRAPFLVRNAHDHLEVLRPPRPLQVGGY